MTLSLWGVPSKNILKISDVRYKKLKEANLKLSSSKGHLFQCGSHQSRAHHFGERCTCNNAFNKLMDSLTSVPILAYPEIGNNLFWIHMLVSESAVAVLSQEIDGQERNIVYFSKRLSKPEINYCVTRKELLAIVKAMEHFHPYIYGRRFLLVNRSCLIDLIMHF
ncbi:retrovirus-related Pol polyprotein from transposon 412 [Trichonephila clavipes]|nr:retrovirus-related Pol polyprotein from transposon 412 [Trichonephila clavipes]